MTEECLKEIEERFTRYDVDYAPVLEVKELIAEVRKLKEEKETWGNEFTAMHTAKLENQTLRGLLSEAVVKLEAHDPPPTNLIKRIDAALGEKK